MWMINVPGAGSLSSEDKFQCPPAHITLEEKDGKVAGTLERIYGNQVVDGYDRNAMPITGSIDNSGNVTTLWEGVPGSGHAAHGHLVISFQSKDCGTRTGVGERY
jgi:hypothetical protein